MRIGQLVNYKDLKGRIIERKNDKWVVLVNDKKHYAKEDELSVYKNFCWHCGKSLNSEDHESCPSCNWLICPKCNACSKDCMKEVKCNDCGKMVFYKKAYPLGEYFRCVDCLPVVKWNNE